ncbi:MAG TPA: 16S rRNA (guanine(527)-N(7))-methyltransferase RsmG [Bacteroidales bacterium]|nr:16S rRNA (guanine(527)-N(7))-methyltransferase RsmG [Bacteroidales bacterium]
MKSILLEHFPDLSNVQLDQYKKFAEIFPLWNQRINCISRKDIDNLFINHILHSLSIAKVFNFSKETTIADIGTGGGFPGIPLAIMFPDVNFDLVDSIGKKTTVVKNISEELNLNNIKAINTRAETLDCKYNVIISRAVTSFPEFYKMVKHILLNKPEFEPNGIIYLKGGDFQNEISGFSKIQIFNIIDYLKFDYFETKKIIYLPINKKSEIKVLNK